MFYEKSTPKVRNTAVTKPKFYATALTTTRAESEAEQKFSEPTSPAKPEATFRAAGDETDASRLQGFLQAQTFLKQKRESSARG